MAKNNTTLPIGVCIFLGVHFLSADLPEASLRGKNGLAKENIHNPLRPHRLHPKPLFRARLPQDCGNFKPSACLRPVDRFYSIYREGVSFTIPNFKRTHPELVLHQLPRPETLSQIPCRLPTVKTCPSYNCWPFKPPPLIQPILYSISVERV